jgi:hypothetical protein
MGRKLAAALQAKFDKKKERGKYKRGEKNIFLEGFLNDFKKLFFETFDMSTLSTDFSSICIFDSDITSKLCS